MVATRCVGTPASWRQSRDEIRHPGGSPQVPSPQQPLLTFRGSQGQLIGQRQGTGVGDLQTPSHLAGVIHRAAHLLCDLGLGRVRAQGAGHRVQKRVGRREAPPQQCPLTFLAQKRGFSWMAQGHRPTPLWLMALLMRPLLWGERVCNTERSCHLPCPSVCRARPGTPPRRRPSALLLPVAINSVPLL